MVVLRERVVLQAVVVLRERVVLQATVVLQEVRMVFLEARMEDKELVMHSMVQDKAVFSERVVLQQMMGLRWMATITTTTTTHMDPCQTTLMKRMNSARTRWLTTRK